MPDSDEKDLFPPAEDFYGGDPIEKEDLSSGDSNYVEEDNADPQPPEEEAVSAEVAEETEEVADTEAKIEAEAKPEGEVEAEAKGEDSKEESAEDIRIPKTRLDHEIARRRALEARLRELEKQAPARGTQQPTSAPQEPPTFDIDTNEIKKALDKTLDGNLDDAVAALVGQFQRVGQEAYNRARTDAISDIDKTIDSVYTSRQNEQTEQQVIDNLESTYDVIRPGSDSFDQDLINEIQALRDGFLGQNYAPADALRVAADYALNMRYPQLINTPESESEPEAKPPAPETRRNPQAIKRNAEAQKAQPPAMPSGTPTDDGPGVVNLEQLTAEEYEALPESTRRRLRGDFLS